MLFLFIHINNCPNLKHSMIWMIVNAVFMVSDSYRRKVFFKYEKRIRMQSPPEKVTVTSLTMYDDIMYVRKFIAFITQFCSLW